MIQQLKEGDQQVLAEVYRLYRSDFIAWMTAKFGCSSEVARDIYQNTMLTLSIKAKSGTLPDLESSLKTYIYGIAKNKYKEYQRSNAHYVQVEDEVWKKLKEENKEDSNEERNKLVLQCLKKLGDPCKSVLELYYFHGMTMEEIKDHLSYKNSATAKNMKYKCFQRLKEIFLKELRKDTSHL